uniref:Uncharacterized protein n=1 Tax=Thermorudis peleae TaxID=1382356 RepID=A0A831TED9_9BACT
MAWWRLRRRAVPEHSPSAAGTTGQETAQPYIREAEQRRLLRLLKRRAELAYDLEQSEQALQPVNRWTERLDELSAAIAQAEADLDALKPPAPRDLPPPLPPIPIEVISASSGPPAQVAVRIDTETFAWREEVDWSERGHQLAPSRLLRHRGDPASVAPASLPEHLREQLIERLSASLDQLAEDLLGTVSAAEPLPSLTLADLARPCPSCGGWQDQRGRCPVCVGLAWRRQQLQADVRRLRTERDATLADLQRARDRLPVIRRQLAEVEADIAALRAKGVEPA